MAVGDLSKRITRNYDGVYGGCKDDINSALDKLRDVFVQFQGIKQINLGVAQMDDITQQNAALAEQTAASSVSMNDQAAHMRQLLAFFNLGEAALPVIKHARQTIRHDIKLNAPEKQALLPAANAHQGWEEF